MILKKRLKEDHSYKRHVQQIAQDGRGATAATPFSSSVI